MTNVRPAKEAQRRVVEVVTVEVVDGLATGTGSNERIELRALGQHHADTAIHLVRIVLAHHPIPADRVIGHADPL
ncbi:hypothetical protein D3C81_2158750 [compost metagenome]